MIEMGKLRKVNLKMRLKLAALVVFDLLVIAIICSSFGLRTDSFQQFIGQRIAGYYSNQLNVDISVGRTSLQPGNDLIIENLCLDDQDGDTLFFVKSIKAKVIQSGISGASIVLDTLEVNELKLNLKPASANTPGNYQFLADYFSTGNEEPDYHINAIKLINCEFSHKTGALIPTKFDYHNMHMRSVNGILSAVTANSTETSLTLDNLSLIDHSGFAVYNASCHCEFLGESVLLRDFIIGTNRSNLKLSVLTIPYSKPGKLDFLVGKSTSGFNGKPIKVQARTP